MSAALERPSRGRSDARVILFGALAIDVLIGVAHVVNAAGLPVLDRSIRLLDVTEEHNLPTWWSSVKLFTIGVVLALLIPRLLAARRALIAVGFAALMFAFLSLDEFAEIHEYLGRRTRFDALPVSGLWPIVFGALALACAAVLAVVGRPIWARDRVAAYCMVGGLLVFAASAAGLDLIVNVGPSGSRLVQVVSFMEAMGEMIAASVMLFAAWRLSAPVPTGTGVP